MGVFICIVFVLFLLMTSCAPLQQMHTIQSNKGLIKTEDRNFTGEKGNTQWWYFDCFFEDGSVMVFLFAPHQWWSEEEKMPSHKSLFYLSYLDPSGEVKIKNKVFDAQQVRYDHNSIKCPYFELTRSHEKNKRNYNVEFFLDDIRGSVKINSGSKAFSPFPTGAMGSFAARHILKLKGKKPSFRYASHVPQGEITADLQVQDTSLHLSGKVYHEQGRFSGNPNQMGEGWNWVHFVSENFNIFGTPEAFFCLEKEGKRLIGGLNLFDKGCVLSDRVEGNEPKNILMGGKLNFSSRQLSFEVLPAGKSTALINIPSVDTDQVWGTTAQPSLVRFNYKGKEYQEKGWLLIETCKMGTRNSNVVKVLEDSKKQSSIKSSASSGID